MCGTVDTKIGLCSGSSCRNIRRGLLFHRSAFRGLCPELRSNIKLFYNRSVNQIDIFILAGPAIESQARLCSLPASAYSRLGVIVCVFFASRIVAKALPVHIPHHGADGIVHVTCSSQLSRKGAIVVLDQKDTKRLKLFQYQTLL